MDAERWARIEQLCQEALERPIEQQTTFLNSACDSDVDLRREVESLLAHRQGAETFMEAGAMDAAAQAFAADGALIPAKASRWIGRLIGRYRIVARVASGGMGDVFRAVRADGTFDKQVAIKLIQGTRSTDFFLSRFQNERQILATLDHPNIARLLDGGTAEEGLPYLVMEFIEGSPIDLFCAKHDLDIPSRLALFRTVCSAVQFAHQNLVVHRDLKPSNILVTSDGVPKLLDFGIAKILNPADRVDPAQQTMTLMRMLTPDYASPEQVRNEPVSTASDVYSLGVILYMLLTGKSPYRLETDSPQEIMKAICDTEPEKPSTACARTIVLENAIGSSQTAVTAKTPSKSGYRTKLQSILEGDLDNIVLKALRKESQRRYSSVEQFSEDIRRHLTGLPVLAHKDTPGYRARKFIGRHTWGVAAAALLVLSLSAGLITTLWQARIAKAERARAEHRFNDVRALANSLIFDIHDSIQELPGATAARKAILERAQQYLDSLAAEARNDPVLLRELALAYARLGSLWYNPRGANLGNSTKALENYRKAVELSKQSVALKPADLQTRRELAQIYTELSIATEDPQGATSARQEATLLLEPLAADPNDLAAQAELARIQELNAGALTKQKDLNPALQAFEKSLVLYQNLAKAEPQNEQRQADVSFGHKHIGSVLSLMNRLDEALDHYRQALAMDEARLAAHPDNLNARFNITFTYSDTGFILRKRGDFDAALSYYRKAFEIRSAMVSADPKDARAQQGLASTYANIASILSDQKKTSGALESFKKSSSIWESLVQRDQANPYLRYRVEESHAYMAEVYADMAVEPHVSRAMQLSYCGKTLRLLEPSLSEDQQRKKAGKLGPGDLQGLAEMQKAHDQCTKLLATPSP